MKLKFLSSAMLLFMLSQTAVRAQNYTKYVNTFIGTTPLTDPKIVGFVTPSDWRPWSGLVFPGASLPNAMVQLSPVTAYHSGAGYQYEDKTILGFAHTNKGHWDYCNIPLLPLSGNTEKYQSTFSHEKESSSPGYYQVYLNDFDVNVKLTSTLRCGFHQYQFKNPTGRKVLFDLAKANHDPNNWAIEQVGNRVLKGFQQTGDKIYFYAELNQDIAKLEKINEGKRDGKAIVHIKDGDDKPVEIKIAISFTSAENAKENFDAEIANKNFEQVKKDANQIWEKNLSHIAVKGGTEKQKQMFYSSLYRSQLWPALRSDVNGEFKDAKRQTVKADFNYYTVPSLWDTYRNKDILLTILSPKITSDIIKSMKDMGEKTGFIPTFFHGDHAASSITGAYLRGVTDFDVKATYDILLKNANLINGPRPFVKEYIEKGFISDPDVQRPHVETKGKAGVSKTLEYAYDDYALAQLAKVVGDSANYRTLMARSQNYKNVFDKSTNFMRGKLEDGSWIQNFNPKYPYYEYMYREANAWQLSFYVPHDMPGLVKLYGGADAFDKKLDSLFTVPWNPKYIARNVETMIGQYCHGNQPDHEAPFAFYFVNKPEKSQKMIDFILNERYGMADGLSLSGMDDAGEMSAWYVFSALGLYPYTAVNPEYLVTVPLFDEVKWTSPEGKVLTIAKKGKSRDLKDIIANGKKNGGYFISHDLLKRGGKIDVVTK